MTALATEVPTADTDESELVERILDDWRLADPARYAAQLLLDFARIPNVPRRRALLASCSALCSAAIETRFAHRGRGKCELLAGAVAQAFGLDVHLTGALVELRWAGLSGSAEERNSHLEHAAIRLASAAAKLEANHAGA
jgi:hypothetical protein